MMTKIYIFISIIAMAMTACGGKSATNDSTDTTADTKTAIVPEFNADSAYLLVKQQCDMGPRVPGTQAHKQCVEWITQKLNTCCDSVVTQTAQVTTFDNTRLNMTNLVGIINPQAEQRLLILAHFDCRPWADEDEDPAKQRQPVMGANDAASGAAVLLELARVMKEKKPEIGIDLLFVDVEDWGEDDNEDSWALGTQYWAQHPHVTHYKPTFGILLDMVGARGATFAPEAFSWQYAQGAVNLLWNTAQKAGFSNYFVMRNEAPGITDDHVPINKAGIPCIDIIDTRSEGGFFDGWHTTHDTLDNIDPATLKAVGQTLCHLIYNF